MRFNWWNVKLPRGGNRKLRKDKLDIVKIDEHASREKVYNGVAFKYVIDNFEQTWRPSEEEKSDYELIRIH